MPSKRVDPTEEPDDLAHALYSAVVFVVLRMRQISSAGDLSMAERHLLYRLERIGPITAADLARAERVTAQAIGALVTGLDAKGMVARQGDPSDRRRALLSATPAASAELRDTDDARIGRIAEALGQAFTAEELAQLAEAAVLLERLGEQL